MARIEITTWTTLHGKVATEYAFDETVTVDGEGNTQTRCIADAVLAAGKTIANAHGEVIP